jgi:hypothetical protein
MIKILLQRPIALLIGTVLAGVLTSSAIGQDAGGDWKQFKPSEREVPKPGSLARVCNGVFEVKWDSGTHWQEKQRMNVIGPIGPNKDLIILPIRSTPRHDTIKVPYLAENVSLADPPKVFSVTTRVKRPGTHNVETNHPLLLFIHRYDREGCPDFGVFHGLYDRQILTKYLCPVRGLRRR